MLVSCFICDIVKILVSSSLSSAHLKSRHFENLRDYLEKPWDKDRIKMKLKIPKSDNFTRSPWPRTSERCQDSPRSTLWVCPILLILFMAHFFASNWESKRTILLLALLLNFDFSKKPFFSVLGASLLSSARFCGIIVQPVVCKLYLSVALTSHRQDFFSVQRAREVYATLRGLGGSEEIKVKI